MGLPTRFLTRQTAIVRRLATRARLVRFDSTIGARCDNDGSGRDAAPDDMVVPVLLFANGPSVTIQGTLAYIYGMSGAKTDIYYREW